ncbi:Protein phosphatase 2C [Legionella gratiana]|uniref:Protein phosphatase 2C n=1 Tax=Legionella gratiana TaxID=45066 RepID=A0A378JH44_9GAMM|nr:hypothetical protein [Legionella gratiana]KTD12085.1 Protein phosphatase 2C [Legionella gratiana]STX46311.1 Protein phosphatase 2C [Legionella gratiana]
MPRIISHPGKYKKSEAENVRYQDKHQPFGYFEMQNAPIRPSQEDALAWETLDQSLDSLSPEEIGKRLWTTYRSLDEQVLEKNYTDGSTASTTVYDGKGNLITATLADAASFAAIYDKEGNLLGVVRLNSVTHKPTDPEEGLRIQQAGGFVGWGRVDGMLAVSRAMGDKSFKEHGVCSEATIDITSIDDLAQRFNISRETIGKIQIITTCDGFTDGTKVETKRGHEQFLYQSLKEIIKSNKKKPELEIAKALALKAKTNDSRDNISVAVQTITQNTPAFLLGVYDGHGGSKVSTYVANHIGDEFKKQCALTPSEYEEQPLSVAKNMSIYQRDNSADVRYERKRQESILSKEESELIIKELLTLTQKYQHNLSKKNREIHSIVEQLLTVLNSSEKNQDTIKEYFKILEKKEEGKAFTNLQIIQNNKDKSTGRFIAGIIAIAATFLTGVLPGLAIIGLVYAFTDKTPKDLFKTYGEGFQADLAEVKEQHDLNTLKIK